MQILSSLITTVFYDGPDRPTTPNLPPVKDEDSASTSDKPPKNPYRWRYLLTHLFLLSLAAAILTILVLLLYRYDNTTVPLWTSTITLNTAIAWLSAAAKLLIGITIAEIVGQAKWNLFKGSRRKLSDLDIADAASRNPLAALGWIVRFRSGFIVHLGAALVVLSFFFEPVIQHSLWYETVVVPDTAHQASVSSNTNYVPVRGFNSGLVLAAPRSLLSGAQSAIFGKNIDVDYACPSGNCTFPLTTTVGVCSSCTEVTDGIDQHCEDLSDKKQFCEGNQCFTSGQLCSYTFAGTKAGNGSVYLDLVAEGTASTSNNDGTVSIPKNSVNLTVLFIQPDQGSSAIPVAPGLNGTNSNPAKAFTCSISYCEKTFNTSVSLGVLKETSSTNPVGSANFKMKIPALSEINDTLYNQTLTLAESGKTNISVAALYGLSSGFSLSLSGNATVLDTLTPSIGQISEFHRALYEDLSSSSFPDVLSKMTDSMTNAVRNDGNQPVTGQSMIKKTFLRIDWEYMAIPGVVWGTTLLLLLWTSFRARKRQEAWTGSSQLAGMFVGIEDEVRRDLDLMRAAQRDKGGMREVGEKLKLRVAMVQAGYGMGEKKIFTRLGESKPASPV